MLCPTRLLVSAGPLTLAMLPLLIGGCGPQVGVINPALSQGPGSYPVPIQPIVLPTATPTATAPVSVVILAGTFNIAPTNANPPTTAVANYNPLQPSKPIAVTVSAQLATSRVGVQLVQTGTSVVLGSNLTPTSATTTVTYTPGSTVGVTILINDTINPGTLQNFNVQVTQAI